MSFEIIFLITVIILMIVLGIVVGFLRYCGKLTPLILTVILIIPFLGIFTVFNTYGDLPLVVNIFIIFFGICIGIIYLLIIYFGRKKLNPDEDVYKTFFGKEKYIVDKNGNRLKKSKKR